MKVLLISNKKTHSNLLRTLTKEGHEARQYTHNKREYLNIGGKLADKLELYRSLSSTGKDGLILFTTYGFEPLQYTLQSRGFTILGGIQRHHLCCDNIAIERILRMYSMQTLPTLQLSSAEHAINFILNNKDRWVLKQSTHYKETSTFVSLNDDGSDLLPRLEEMKNKNVSKIYLQKYASGIEIDIQRFFNGTTWVGPIGVHHKHVNATRNGMIIWNTSNHDFPLFVRTLFKLTPYFKNIRYRGNITITCIVQESNVWPIRFKFGLGSLPAAAQCELYTSPVGEFLHNIAKGRHAGIAYKEGYAIATSTGSSRISAFGETIPKAQQELVTLSRDTRENIVSKIGDKAYMYEIPTLSRWGWI